MNTQKSTVRADSDESRDVGTVWQVGDTLVFGIHGVCQITGIQQNMDGTRDYVLEPVYDARTRLLVPMSSEVLLDKMHPVLDRKQVDAFISTIPERPLMWVEKPTARKEIYHAVLRKGDRVELSRVIKTLHVQEKRMQAKGKHLYRSDEQVLTDATRMLYQEFAFAIGIEPSEVEDYIKQKLSA